MNTSPSSPPATRPPLLRLLVRGAFAGLLAGLVMLLVMVVLRSFLGIPAPIEMIFDRLFPLLTVKFFIGSLVRAGGYTPLKLQGLYGALAGQMGVAAFGGVVYALFLERWCPQPDAAEPVPRQGWVERRGWWLIVPGVLAAWVLFIVVLWPNEVTSFRGLPPTEARPITILVMLLDFAVCGVAIMLFDHGLAARRAAAPPAEADARPSLTRRAFLAGGVGAVAAVITGALMHRLYLLGTFFYDGRQYTGPGVQKITPIVPEDEFYQVSKNFVDPDPVRDSWALEVGGSVENPRTYSFAEIAAMPSVEQETTLLCISYGVGSGLCSNALWKGVPLPQLLALAKPKGDPKALLFHAADGFYEKFDIKKAMEPTTLLAYGMNGQPLPQRHGYPLRMIVPGRYGEKNPKWVTKIEVLDAADPRLHVHRGYGYGFYEEQGWGPNDVVPTHSRIDAPQVNGGNFAEPFKVGQKVEFRGVAMGGDRGISKVEVSTDGGKTYHAADIYAPGTKICWSLWRYEWTPTQPVDDVGIYVRAVDGEGQPQIETFRDQVPHGSTGLHWVHAKVV